MPRKKTLKPTPVETNRMAQLMQRLQTNGANIDSASGTMSKWRYLDFYNPLQQLPCLSLEWLFGARGFLAGRIMQLRAKYSKGKSSFMYLTYAAAQAMSQAFCLHIETEGASAPADYIASFGADPHDLMVAELSSLEDCLARIDEIICQVRGGFGGGVGASGQPVKTKFTDPIDAALASPIVIGIDSLSSLGAEAGVNVDIADVGSTSALSYHTRKLREFFRHRVARFRDTQTFLMLASHETATIEMGGKRSFGGNSKGSLAGEAIGIQATYGADLESRKYVDKAIGKEIGSIVSIETFKNKLSPPHRKLELYLVWNKGFDLVKTDVEFLINHSASPFAQEDGSKVLYRHSQGITCKPLSDKSFKSDEEFLRALYENESYLAEMREKMRIRGHGFDFEQKFQLPDEDDDAVEQEQE